MKLRSQLDGRYMGTGMSYAFNEKEDTYEDIKVKRVKMPNDASIIYEFANLAGEVKTYTLTQEELEKYRRMNLKQ